MTPMTACGTTTTMVQETPDQASDPVTPKPANMLIFNQPAGGKWAKCYWTIPKEELWSSSGYVLIVESTEDQVGHPGDAAATASLWPPLWRHPEESSTWRGVFTLAYPRRTIFTDEVEIRTDQLRQWRPHITIDRRTIERADG